MARYQPSNWKSGEAAMPTSDRPTTYYGWGGTVVDADHFNGIAYKLRTYAGIYTGDKEAREMADWCERVASAPSHAALLAEERERLAKAIEAELLQLPMKDRGLRVGMALAASLVRRGRALTPVEKMTNLKKGMDEFEAEEAARAALEQSQP